MVKQPNGGKTQLSKRSVINSPAPELLTVGRSKKKNDYVKRGVTCSKHTILTTFGPVSFHSFTTLLFTSLGYPFK